MNLLKVKSGTKFSAFIKDIFVQGKIQKENNFVFLCQNNNDGLNCTNKLGYEYSWRVGNGSKKDLLNNDVSQFTIGHKELKQRPNLDNICGFKPIISKGYVTFGCQRVNNITIKALVKQLKD